MEGLFTIDTLKLIIALAASVFAFGTWVKGKLCSPSPRLPLPATGSAERNDPQAEAEHHVVPIPVPGVTTGQPGRRVTFRVTVDVTEDVDEPR